MKYSPATIKKIVKYVSMGLTNEQAARCAGVCEATYYVWVKEKPELSELLKRAKDQGESANLAIIHKARTKSWAAAAWLLERQHQGRYSLRHEISGPRGTAIPIKVSRVELGNLTEDVLTRLLTNLEADPSRPPVNPED